MTDLAKSSWGRPRCSKSFFLAATFLLPRRSPSINDGNRWYELLNRFGLLENVPLLFFSINIARYGKSNIGASIGNSTMIILR